MPCHSSLAAETGANAAATGQTAAPAEPAAEPAATEPAAQDPAAAPETPSAEQPAGTDESMETAALDTSAENTETPAEDAVVTTEAPEKGWNPVWIILLVGVMIIIGIGMMLVKNKEEK